MNRLQFYFPLIFFVLLPSLVAADGLPGQGGVLYVSPENAQHSVGDVFDVQVLVDSGGVSINAAEADIAFNPAAVEVQNLSVDGSLLDVWPTPPVFSNKEGYVRLSGLMKNAFTGTDGHLATITFRALRNMSSNARFAAGAILAADGQSSNIITSMKSGVFTIQPKEIVATSSPNSYDQPAPVKPGAPVFTSVQSEVNAGDHFEVRGIADPNIKIAMYVSHGGESPVRSDISSAADGSFAYLSDAAKSGVYHMYATAVSADGIVSDPSLVVSITVLSVGFAAAALFGVSVMYQLMPLALLLVLAGLGGGYILHRHKIAKLHHGRGHIS
jgi:hypothetical protein